MNMFDGLDVSIDDNRKNGGNGSAAPPGGQNLPKDSVRPIDMATSAAPASSTSRVSQSAASASRTKRKKNTRVKVGYARLNEFSGDASVHQSLNTGPDSLSDQPPSPQQQQAVPGDALHIGNQMSVPQTSTQPRVDLASLTSSTNVRIDPSKPSITSQMSPPAREVSPSPASAPSAPTQENKALPMPKVKERDIPGEEQMVAAAPPQFSEWFARADGDGDGLISGGEAFQFFMRTGLAKPDLATIWDIVISRQKTMDKTEFILACHLVGLKQHIPQIELKNVKRAQIPGAIKKSAPGAAIPVLRDQAAAPPPSSAQPPRPQAPAPPIPVMQADSRVSMGMPDMGISFDGMSFATDNNERQSGNKNTAKAPATEHSQHVSAGGGGDLQFDGMQMASDGPQPSQQEFTSSENQWQQVDSLDFKGLDLNASGSTHSDSKSPAGMASLQPNESSSDQKEYSGAAVTGSSDEKPEESASSWANPEPDAAADDDQPQAEVLDEPAQPQIENADLKEPDDSSPETLQSLQDNLPQEEDIYQVLEKMNPSPDAQGQEGSPTDVVVACSSELDGILSTVRDAVDKIKAVGDTKRAERRSLGHTWGTLQAKRREMEAEQEEAIGAEDFEKAEAISVELNKIQEDLHAKEELMDGVEESIRTAESAKESVELYLLDTLMSTAITGLKTYEESEREAIADINLEEADTLQTLAEEKEKEAAKLLQEVEDLRSQILTIKAAEEKRGAVDAAATEISKMETQYSELKEMVDTSKQSRAERDELHQKEEHARKKLSTVKSDIVTLEQEYQKAEDDYRADAAELSKARARAAHLSDEIAQLEESKKRAVSSKDFREAGKLAAELKTKTAEKSEVDQYLDSKQGDSDGSKSIEDMRLQLASLKEESSSLDATIAHCRSRRLGFIASELAEEIDRASNAEDFDRAEALQQELDVIQSEIDLLDSSMQAE